MMGRSSKRSAVNNRRGQIIQQLDRIRSQLVKRRPSNYASDTVFRRQLKRSRELISDLESELLILDCPGEYDELPAAVVADEMGLTCEQVRNLIKVGEIAATGRPAHERICRGELERIASAGAPALLRLGQEEPAEIFEQAVPHLQKGDLEAAWRAYRRLEARQSWRGPHAPAFLVGLELAAGDLDGAMSSMKLIYEHEDPVWRTLVMAYLARVLRGMRLTEKGARGLRDQLVMLAEGGAVKCESSKNRQPKQPREKRLDELRRRAIYLTTAVMSELRNHELRDRNPAFDDPSQRPEGEVNQIIRDAIYTALYAEAFYDKSSASRMYADATRRMIPKRHRPPGLLKSLSQKAGRDGRSGGC